MIDFSFYVVSSLGAILSATIIQSTNDRPLEISTELHLETSSPFRAPFASPPSLRRLYAGSRSPRIPQLAVRLRPSDPFLPPLRRVHHRKQHILPTRPHVARTLQSAQHGHRRGKRGRQVLARGAMLGRSGGRAGERGGGRRGGGGILEAGDRGGWRGGQGKGEEEDQNRRTRQRWGRRFGRRENVVWMVRSSRLGMAG